MPIKNGIEFIEESVGSIKSQIFEDWELVIGINGCGENSETYQKAKKYENQKIHVYDMPECKGKSATLNALVKKAKYDWISLLDVDDKWKPTKLMFQESYMTDYDVIGTQAIYFGDLSSSPSLPVGDLRTFNFFQFNPIINSSCLLRKDYANWDETTTLEDYDLWLKLWKKGKRFYNVPSIETYHRIHSDSAFNSKGNHKLVDEIKRRYM